MRNYSEWQAGYANPERPFDGIINGKKIVIKRDDARHQAQPMKNN